MVPMFAIIFIALWVGHGLGDLWVQTHTQARDKGLPGNKGRKACATHVATLTLVKLAVLGITMLVLGLGVSPAGLILGTAVDAASHYWADRRVTLARLAHALGKDAFYTLGAPRPGRDDNPTLGSGAYALDQAWHHGWLWAAALVMTAL